MGGRRASVQPSGRRRGIVLGGGRDRAVLVLCFDDGDLVLAVEPPPQVDQLATLAAERECAQWLAGGRLTYGLLARRTKDGHGAAPVPILGAAGRSATRDHFFALGGSDLDAGFDSLFAGGALLPA